MLNKLDANFLFQQEALNLRAQRQEILASNIANADTPGYQARDIDFSSELTKAVEQGRKSASGLSMTTTSDRHLPGQATASSASSLDLLYRVPDQPALDGNTVDMDRERVNFADNSLRYQTNLTVLGGQLKSMTSVLEDK